MIDTLYKSAGLKLTEDQQTKLDLLADIVLEKNKVLNLTSIREKDELMVKQILNSLFLNKYLKFSTGFTIADLGTGGGFPGLPLAITHPECEFTLIDSVQKKIKAVQEFAQALNLKNVLGISERLEVLGQNPKYREKFDLVVAQALAPLPVLLELSIPLVKMNGFFAALKGPGYEKELNEAKNAINQLKCNTPIIKSYELPNGIGERHILIFQKTTPTPHQFPRQIGIPNKKPL